MLAGTLLTPSGNLEIKNNNLEIIKEYQYTFEDIHKIDLVIKSVHADLIQINQIANNDLIDFDDLQVEKEIISNYMNSVRGYYQIKNKPIIL